MKGPHLTTSKDGKIVVKVPLSSQTVKAKRSQHLEGQLPQHKTTATRGKPQINVMRNSNQHKAHKTTATQPGKVKKNTTAKPKLPVTGKRTKTTNPNNSKTTKGTQGPSETKPHGQTDTGKPKVVSNVGGAQLVLTSKMKTFEPRFEHAITIKFTAKDTNQEEKGEGNTIWLQRAGYKEEEITDHLLETFKWVFCRRFKPAAEVLRISEEDQPWNYFWVRKKKLYSDMIEFLTRWLKLVETLEKNKNAYFERTGVTSMKIRSFSKKSTWAQNYTGTLRREQQVF
jgi:hypothetical protein